MSDQYIKRALPWTTVTPSDLSALDLDDISAADFRPILWWGRQDEIKEQSIENDTGFLAFLENPSIIGSKFDMTEPTIKWRVGRPADMWTTNNKIVAAADTYMDLVDSLIVRPGFLIHFSDYSTTLRVLDVDDDKSSGWTNDAADTCNIQFERLTGPTVAIPVGNVAEAGIPAMSEIGTPHRGTTTVPGDPIYNLMTLTGIYGSISKLQMDSDMIGGWGTHPKVHDDIYYQYRLRKQQSLLFEHRYTGTDSQVANSQLYIGSGLIPQIKTHIMEAGSLGVTLGGPTLNDFWESTFDSMLSGSIKHHFCGSAQYRDARKASEEAGLVVEMLGIQSGAQNPMSLGTNSFDVTLQSGRHVIVHELKKAFSAGNKVDWGVTVDPDNIGFGAYRNWQEVWVDDIESKAQAITLRSDALVDTYCLNVRDETTCAVIRGGTRALVER